MHWCKYSLNSKLFLYEVYLNLQISKNSPQQTEICVFVEFENIGNFEQNHNLLLNPEKTNFLHFKPSQYSMPYEHIFYTYSIEKKNTLSRLVNRSSPKLE